MNKNNNDEYCMYEGSIDTEEGNTNYTGIENTKWVKSSNPIIKQPVFAMHQYMSFGKTKVEQDVSTVKEKRDLISSALTKLVGNEKVEIRGECVGYGEDIKTHFIVSFIHNGKLISLKGNVIDLGLQ